MSKTSKTQEAVDWAVGIASDSAHGYDQTSRWGPDYDCSSLVISAYEQAGVPVKSCGATYTGNMRAVFAQCGFSDVSASVNKTTGAGLLPGDVLLHERNHTALYIGGGKIVHASGNERGGITGGQTGDQTGGEICVRGYYNYPWDCVLRYEEEKDGTAPSPDAVFYAVQPGDTLWTLAESWLGAGERYPEILSANGLDSERLQVGQLLKRPEGTKCTAVLPRLSYGDQSAAVESMQLLLAASGYVLPLYGADGQWGGETRSAMERFQQENGLRVGPCDGETWAALIG